VAIFSGTEGLLVWNDNWVSFLDAMLQMQIIAVSGRELRLPTRIRSLRIDPVGHEKFVRTLDDGTKGILVEGRVLTTYCSKSVTNYCNCNPFSGL